MAEDIPEFGVAVAGADYQLRPGGYLVLRDARGEVAVVSTPRGFFLPGGGQEDGEIPESAAVREAEEECGLCVRVTGLLGRADELVFAPEEGRYYRKRCTFFSAELVWCGPGWEADHELMWRREAAAALRLSHQSQRWAVSLARRLTPGMNRTRNK